MFDTLQVAGGLASIAGLAFSFLAFRRAERARSVAEQVRRDLMVRSFAEELALACEKASELLDFLHHNRFSEARLRATELSASLSEMPNRRSRHASEEIRNSLLTTRTQVDSIEAILGRGSKTTLKDGPSREFMLQCARSVIHTLREMLGTLKADLD